MSHHTPPLLCYDTARLSYSGELRLLQLNHQHHHSRGRKQIYPYWCWSKIQNSSLLFFGNPCFLVLKKKKGADCFPLLVKMWAGYFTDLSNPFLHFISQFVISSSLLLLYENEKPDIKARGNDLIFPCTTDGGASDVWIIYLLRTHFSSKASLANRACYNTRTTPSGSFISLSSWKKNGRALK